MNEEDEKIKNLNSQIKQLESEKSKYIEQKKKDKFIEEHVKKFKKKLFDIINTYDGVRVEYIENELDDVEQSFSYLFSQLYTINDKGYQDEELNRKIDESISSLSEQKNYYIINIDILIASLERMRPKKKEGK